MKRMMLPAAGLALAAIAPAGASAAVKSDGTGPKGPTAAHARAYERAYHEVARRFGHRTPGRNIVRWGLSNGRPATDARTVASLHVLEDMLAPPPSPAPVASPEPSAISTASSTTTAPVVSSAGASAAGASGVPACASESGTNYSTGPSNTNASSGATGRYQILPSTAAGYGCNLSTPAGQDACAQTIYAHQGAGAWVGCGG